jgi:hypothetical protein
MIYALYQYLEADNNEKLAPSLPLINMHKRASFLQRVMQNMQIYHLLVSIVQYIFGPYITPSNDAGLQELNQNIFRLHGPFTIELVHINGTITIHPDPRTTQHMSI